MSFPSINSITSSHSYPISSVRDNETVKQAPKSQLQIDKTSEVRLKLLHLLENQKINFERQSLAETENIFFYTNEAKIQKNLALSLQAKLHEKDKTKISLKTTLNSLEQQILKKELQSLRMNEEYSQQHAKQLALHGRIEELKGKNFNVLSDLPLIGPSLNNGIKKVIKLSNLISLKEANKNLAVIEQDLVTLNKEHTVLPNELDSLIHQFQKCQGDLVAIDDEIKKLQKLFIKAIKTAHYYSELSSEYQHLADNLAAHLRETKVDI